MVEILWCDDVASDDDDDYCERGMLMDGCVWIQMRESSGKAAKLLGVTSGDDVASAEKASFIAEEYDNLSKASQNPQVRVSYGD